MKATSRCPLTEKLVWGNVMGGTRVLMSGKLREGCGEAKVAYARATLLVRPVLTILLPILNFEQSLPSRLCFQSEKIPVNSDQAPRFPETPRYV